jgi:hypothetical protein
MRPWFTLTIIGILACCLLVFLFIVDFVLINREMFEMPFNITIRVPFTSWSHIWTEVQFMYILSTSILLGAAIVALTTLIFDTKRALKVRSMRKELARLQKALQEAQALMPEQTEHGEKADAPAEDMSEEETSAAIEPVENEEPVTPEEITHSFEDAVEQGDFLKVAQKRVEDELERHDGLRPEGNIRARVTDTDAESADEQPQPEDTHQAEVPDEDLQRDHETPSAEDVISLEEQMVSELPDDGSAEVDDASPSEEETATSDDSAESSVPEKASLEETESSGNQDQETAIEEAEIIEEDAGQEQDAPKVNEKETAEAKKTSDD